MGNNTFDKLEIQWSDENDSNDDIFAEKKQGSSDFAAMLDGEQIDNLGPIRIGEKVRCTISSISNTGDDVIVDVGNKNTGIISKAELQGEAPEFRYNIGDEIEVFVVSNKDGELLLSQSMSQSAQAADDLKNAYANKIPVKGRVIKENKGGFDIQIFGKNAFCPVSQIDLHFVDNKAEFIGKEFNFLIQKLEGTRNIIVSRAALLLQEIESKIEDLRKYVETGEVLEGVVSDIRNFGVFVKVAGVEGLVHISELSHGRVEQPEDVYKKGDKVFVKVIDIDTYKGRPKISMSIKQAGVDPWDKIQDLYKVGDKYNGKVVRLETFGAFVELMPGIDGLIHVSEMSWVKRVKHPSDLLSLGDMVTCSIVSIDPMKKQVALTLKDIKDDPWYEIENKYKNEAEVSGKISRLKDFGAIVELEPGITGLLPTSTMKKVQASNYKKYFSPPKEIEVKVAKVDPEEKKILLTLPNIEEDSDADTAFEQYSAKQVVAEKKLKESKDVGSFGSLLLEKMNKK